MEIKEFYIVEARHPNVGILTELKVFTKKKEAVEFASMLAKKTADEIEVFSKEGLIKRFNPSNNLDDP